MKSSFDSTSCSFSARINDAGHKTEAFVSLRLLSVSLHADSSFFRPQAFRVNININISHTHLHHSPTGWVLGGYRV